MVDGAQKRITTLEDRIQNSDTISEADRQVLDAFNDRLHLLSNQYSPQRHEKLLRHCVIISEKVGGLADALDDRDAAEEIVRWINRTYDNEETNRDYRVAVRVFGRHVTEGDDPPPSIEWVPSGTSKTYDPAPRPEDMLTWDDDVLPMIEAAHNPRDTAAIALQFDAGLRGGEFTSLTVGDISDHPYGLQVTVDGKQGRRTITLIPSVPYVNKWLDAHPADRNDGDAPLWSKLTTPEPISETMIRKMFREPAARAFDVPLRDGDGNKRPQGEIIDDLPKPVTPTNFRKSSASHLASKGVNQAHIEEHHGWVRGSKVASRYVSVFSDDTDRELARAYGREVVEEDEDGEIAPVDCPRCERETPRDKSLCVWCGQALEPGAAKVAESVEDILVDGIADADDETERQAFKKKYDKVRSDPEERAELVDSLAEDLREA